MSEPLSKRIKAYVPVEGGEEPAERLSVDELFAWCLDAQALETEVASWEASETTVYKLAEDLKAEVLEARTAGAAKFHVALDTAIDRFCEEHLGATWERELKQIVARAWLAVFDEPVDAVTPDATPVDGADHRRLMKDVRAALYFEITALDEYLEEGRLRQS